MGRRFARRVRDLAAVPTMGLHVLKGFDSLQCVDLQVGRLLYPAWISSVGWRATHAHTNV